MPPNAAAQRSSKRRAAGQMELLLRAPGRGGTTHLVMSPLEFMPLQTRWQICRSQIQWFCV